MRLLLDTHVMLWWESGVELDRKAIAAIRSAERVYVSAAVAWEIAIKAALGRLRIQRTVEEMTDRSGFEQLPVYFHHTAALADLPLHHRDPFDRMLAAQALSEELTLVTRDEIFAQYPVKLMRA